MNTNKRRVETTTNSTGVGNVTLDLPLDDSDAVNLHGLRCCGSIEPEDGGANANGVWAVWCLPGGVIQNADLPLSIGGLGSEDSAPYLWGLGCWVASNESTYNFEFAPKTSRNCQKGARIVFRIIKDGVSAGNVRVNMIITGFTTS